MKVKYFAWVRERVGKAEETVEPPPNVRTVDELIAWLAQRGETYAYAFEKPRVIRAAIDRALDGGINLGAHNLLEARFARAVCDRFKLDRVRFTNSGTEANLMAISVARVFTRRPKVMVMEGSGTFFRTRNKCSHMRPSCFSRSHSSFVAKKMDDFAVGLPR